ncbi:MAG TPA: type IV pilin-like G/H family protein [Allocoleopsis sp.]
MNTDLKFKVLQYVNHQKKSSGFTFIELLIIIMILGILAAIALPSFLSQAGKGKQSEARTYIGTINKGEQAYYQENKKFAFTIEDLKVGIRTASINYNYHLKVINKGTNAIAVGYSSQTPAGTALKNYVGFVSLIISKDNPKNVTSSAILCEQRTASVPASFNIEWKPGIESPNCNSSQVQVGGTN